MLKIAALNEELSQESSASDELSSIPTKESEEIDSLNLYKEALNHRQKNDFDAALQLFHATLDIPSIQNASSAFEKDNVQSQQLSSTTQIKYACLKNIAALYVLKGSVEEAVEAYLEAVEVDPYDVSVWYQIGKLSVEINNIQLARHAYLQGLTCSPNHWPCLDGLISILYGVGDDLACLLYINRALGKDPFYSKGAILRDKIFESNYSLKEDVKKFTINDKWAPLFDTTCTYEESEKIIFLDEVHRIREAVGGQYKQTILDDSHLSETITSISWKAVGDCLLNTYAKTAEESKAFKLSCPIQLQTSPPLATSTFTSSDVVDELEVKKCLMDEQNLDISSVGEEDHAMDINCPIIEPSNKSLLHEEDKITNPTSGNIDHDVKPEIIVNKTETNKRKRCSENGNSDQVSERETNQRRSTRSRAYAQQVEEDIYSLRAELRSFLPTSLLLEEKIIEAPSIETGQKENYSSLVKYPITDESENASNFFTEAQSSKLGIIDLISRYCEQLVLLDGLEWPEELRNTYLKAYHIMRNHVIQLEVFNHFESNLNFDEPSMKNGFGSLMHAEMLLYFFKTNPKTEILPWFIEDITFLFQLADRSDFTGDRFQTFKARVYWLYCNWHFHHGRVEEAISILDLIKTCFGHSQLEAFDDSNSQFSFHTYSTEKMLCFVGERDIKAMEDILTRTLKLGEIKKLHQEKKFADLVNILKTTLCATIAKVPSSKTNVEDPVSRPSQLEMLLDGLSNLEDFDEYLIVAEKGLNESTASYLTIYGNHEKECEATEDPISDWAKVIERISNEINEILQLRRTSLAVLNRHCLARFAENLVLICSHQLETSDTSSKMPFNTTIFWILLHRVIEFEEHRQDLIKREQDLKENSRTEEGSSTEELDEEALPCSILFLISSHDLLGKRSWCMLKNGLFVIYLLEVLLKKRRTVHDPEDRDELGRAIEQASYCGLAYPTGKKTKSRSMSDHSVEAVSFTWPRVLLLAEYFLPTRKELPEFDTVKPTSNAEQEILLQKLVSLIPPELDPKNRLDDLQSFIQGKQPNIPEYLAYNGMPCEVESVFYLLADYYFKNKDWVKAIENYTLDLALVPARFDSWAALALATGSRLETKLNSCERLKNIGSFLDQAEAALRCFRRALRLRPLQTTLWIEQGSTAYMLSSFCSQLIRNETDALSIELFERLEKERERMLDIAHDCFVAADKSWLVAVEKDNTEEQDERWLHHYMLGKIAEKRAKPFVEFIQHYQRAAELLEESSAAYPRKISYNTPAHLSVEALEIYYRIHSNCLKALMHLQDKSSDEDLSLAVFKQLELTAKGCFACGGRRSSVEQKEESDKEPAKRKASSKHENESAAKKPLLDKAGQHLSKESRGTNISDVTFILDEIITEVVKIAQSKSFGNTPLISNEEKPPVSLDDGRLSPLAESIAKKEHIETEDPKFSPSTKTPQATSSSVSSDTDDSGARGAVRDSTLTHSESAPENPLSDSKALQEVKQSPDTSTDIKLTVPENSVMVEMCISAIKDCVSRFPHFYKGLYRLAHYFYHSKVSHNLEACRELLFGRPLSASIVQLQQQQGTAQTRFLPTGVPGLFTEWRSNNFFHGIWRIPVNEIDRPGCFAAHCGRSTALLLDVLKDTRDHRLLMELYLALQPEPEPDKKYLFDSEREQHASLSLTLTLQVLKLRLQEIKESPNTSLISSSGHNTSPQGNSSSKKLSLLMDAFRAYDRVGRNLPGQESIFGTLIVECFKMYKSDTRETNENEASQLEQALAFCRNKQAQSRVRVRGGLAPSASLGVVSTRGKRGLSSRPRGSRQSGSNRTSSVRENQGPHNPLPHSSSNTLPTQSSGTVMQEAMKLLQSAGGSADNLPHHLKNIPGIKNLLAMFSESQTQSESEKKTAQPVAAQSSPTKPSVKKSAPKSATPNFSLAGNLSSESLLQSLTGASGSSLATTSALSNIGLMDPSFLAMLSNPYINPLNMMGGATGGVDASSISRIQNEYQQQLMGWMQNALAQSYMLSGFNQSFLPPPSNSGNRSRGGAKSSNRQGGKARTETAPSGKASSSVGTSASSSTSSSSVRTSSSEVKAAAGKVTGTLNRPESLGETQSSNFKFPMELSESKVSDKNSKLMSVQEHGGKSKNLLPHTSQKTPSSSSRVSSKLNKGPVSAAIDTTKFGGHVPFDTTGMLGKDQRGSGKSVISRSKEPTSASMDFPINLGRDITVTTTSSSKSTNPISLPVSSNVVGKTKSSHLMGFAGTSTAPHLLTHSHQLASSFSRPSDPLAFSILQNLPSSMSLLVKSAQSPHASGKSSGPVDYTSSKLILPHQNPPPKLTPAPGFQGSKKKKSLSSPQPHLPSLKSGSSSSSSSNAAKIAEQEKTANYADDDVVVLD